MNKTDRVEWVYFGLAVLGMLVAGLLTTFHYSERAEQAYCTGAAGCGSVNDSEYAELFDVPIALLGLGSYGVVAGLALLAIRRWRYRDWVPLAVFGISLCATLYSAFLTYLELYVIHAICPWCAASAVISVGIFVAAMADLLVLRPGPILAARS